MDRGLKQYIYNLYGDLTIMKIILKNLFVILFLGLIPCGCNNDPTSPEEVHTDADGFVLEDENGNQIYREFEGATTGSVTINVGQSMELSVHFLDHDGDEIEHEEGEEEEGELSVSENDSNVAAVEVEDNDEGEGDHHEMAIHVIGVSSGSTNFRLQLMHVSHDDYTSTNKIPVTVE